MHKPLQHSMFDDEQSELTEHGLPKLEPISIQRTVFTYRYIQYAIQLLEANDAKLERELKEALTISI